MKILITIGLTALFLLYGLGVAIADAPSKSPQSLESLISTYSKQYGVSADLMTYIVQAESTGSTTIQSNYYYKGKRENSFGLAQINLDWNPDVTREQAQDPDFALNFLASNLKAGKCYLWSTCPKS